MMGPPPTQQRRYRSYDETTTPPRRSKRIDERSSAERGIRKEREEDFKTPLKAPNSLESSSSTSGRGISDAPMRARRVRARPELHQDDELTDAEMTDNLAEMLNNCTKLE
jgi:hypothetical protein